MKMITATVLLWANEVDINADDIVMVEEVEKEKDFNIIAKEVCDEAINIQDEEWQEKWLKKQEEKLKKRFEKLPNKYTKIHFRSGGMIIVGENKKDIYNKIRSCEIDEMRFKLKYKLF